MVIIKRFTTIKSYRLLFPIKILLAKFLYFNVPMDIYDRFCEILNFRVFARLKPKLVPTSQFVEMICKNIFQPFSSLKTKLPNSKVLQPWKLESNKFCANSNRKVLILVPVATVTVAMVWLRSVCSHIAYYSNSCNGNGRHGNGCYSYGYQDNGYHHTRARSETGHQVTGYSTVTHF